MRRHREQRTSRFWKRLFEKRLGQKLINHATTAGREVVEIALKLFYASQSTETPKWAKTIIYGALGYFINPVDAIPDLTPAVGYVDDLGVLVAALAIVAIHITPDIAEKAKQKASDWFGDKKEADPPESAP